MRHFVVKVANETFVIVADSPKEAKTVALNNWLTNHGIRVEEPEQIYCPCQWGDPCPNELITCGACLTERIEEAK